MENWKEIKTQQDIDDLLDLYDGFHDGCLAKAAFQSGAHVDDQLRMGFGDAEDYTLLVTFERQWRPKTLELKFIGLRRCHLVGYEFNYFALLFEAYLTFVEGLLPGEPKRLIVWSDAPFEPSLPLERFEEPGESYIIANGLQWKITE